MEEKLRGGDKKVKGCLMVDTLREVDAETMRERLSNQFSMTEVGVFRVLSQLGRVPCRGSLPKKRHYTPTDYGCFNVFSAANFPPRAL